MQIHMDTLIPIALLLLRTGIKALKKQPEPKILPSLAALYVDLSKKLKRCVENT